MFKIEINFLSRMMKRKYEIENSQSTKREKTLQFSTSRTGLREIESFGDNHLVWEIIIPKLDYQSRLKMSYQNHRFEEFIRWNAEADLRKFRRHIQNDKYM